jgi:serine protease Do
MNKAAVKINGKIPVWVIWLLVLLVGMAASSQAQQFNFDRLNKRVREYTVIVDMQLEVSFGIHSSEQQERYLGTVVTDDGLVMFNGSDLSGVGFMPGMPGISIIASPTSVEVQTLDGDTYEGEYLGVDRFTEIGFLRIIDAPPSVLRPIEFKDRSEFRVGEWLALYMLLPEFIDPPLAADVGMVSSNVQTPEDFTLTVGFHPLQRASVLFDEDLEPVGVLGTLVDASAADAGELMEALGQYGVPLLGVITADRLERVIADPPSRGGGERGWLGIRLQALTSDIAEYWSLDAAGGIIVNETMKNSPAIKAGLQVGDVIIMVDGLPVEVDRDENLSIFQRWIAELGPGAEVEFTVLRPTVGAADTLTLAATLEKAPIGPTDAPEYENEYLEFKVRDLVFDDYLYMNQDPETFHGVFVSELGQGGLADIGGLQFGDIIQRIGETDINSVDDAEAAMKTVEQSKPREVILFVWRNNQTMFVNLKTDWE